MNSNAYLTCFCTHSTESPDLIESEVADHARILGAIPSIVDPDFFELGEVWALQLRLNLATTLRNEKGLQILVIRHAEDGFRVCELRNYPGGQRETFDDLTEALDYCRKRKESSE